MFEFRTAVLEKTTILVALAGPSGCGKTKSALRLARGLVGPDGLIYLIDSESRRGLHYAQQHSYLHGEIKPPFRPDNFGDAVDAAITGGAQAIIIDSFSHEFDGTGGLMEWADSIPGGAGQNWKEPKKHHKLLMNKLLQAPCHVIFCLRADEKIKIVKDDKGKNVAIPLGWVPICEKRFMYEMTCSFVMHDAAPGIPIPIKLQDQHRAAFPLDKQIDEESGAFLGRWANSGSGEVSKPTHRLIKLFRIDGSQADYGKADEWLEAFRAQIEIADQEQLDSIWEQNKDLLYRIEVGARERKDNHLVKAANAVGRLALSRVAVSEKEEEPNDQFSQ